MKGSLPLTDFPYSSLSGISHSNHLARPHIQSASSRIAPASYEDKIYASLTFDAIQGKRHEISKSDVNKNPATQTRGILTQGGELVLREETQANIPETAGREARATASLMFVPIRNGTRVIG